MNVEWAKAGDVLKDFGVVAEACSFIDGHIYCVNHQTHATKSVGWWSHSDDSRNHFAVWMCDEHGAESVGCEEKSARV